jgi:hypothetical protein
MQNKINQNRTHSNGTAHSGNSPHWPHKDAVTCPQGGACALKCPTRTVAARSTLCLPLLILPSTVSYCVAAGQCKYMKPLYSSLRVPVQSSLPTT